MQDKLRFAGEKIPSMMMPNHLHGILFVQKAMEAHLGQVIFERGYNDLISKSYDMLPRLTAYLHANPRRLAIRRERPYLFKMHRKTEMCGLQFTSLGNHFLLDWPKRQLVGRVLIERLLIWSNFFEVCDFFCTFAV